MGWVEGAGDPLLVTTQHDRLIVCGDTGVGHRSDRVGPKGGVELRIPRETYQELGEIGGHDDSPFVIDRTRLADSASSADGTDRRTCGFHRAARLG